MPNLEEDILTNWNLSVSVGTNPVLRCESIHLIGIVKSFPISNTSRILSENELYCHDNILIIEPLQWHAQGLC